MLRGRAYALEQDKAALRTTAERPNPGIRHSCVTKIQGYKIQVTAHNAVASDYHKQHADMESSETAQYKARLRLGRSAGRKWLHLKRENDLLSAGLSWGERAEYTAKAEAAQLIPPTSSVAPQGAPDQAASAALYPW